MTKAAQTPAKAARRTPEEAKLARIEREERLAQKAKERAERLAAQLKTAEDKEKKAIEKKTQIENNVSTRVPKEPLPTIKESVQKKFTREIGALLKSFGAANGLVFEDFQPRITRQGSGMAVHLAAQVQEAVAKVKRVAKSAAGATREAARFMENHKLVGIGQKVLGKEVTIAGQDGTFKVLGMKGRTNDIVLQKVGSDDVTTMKADEFKTNMALA